MAQGTLPGFISALRAGLRPVALRNVLRASRAHPSFPFSFISGFIDSLRPHQTVRPVLYPVCGVRPMLPAEKSRPFAAAALRLPVPPLHGASKVAALPSGSVKVI